MQFPNYSGLDEPTLFLAPFDSFAPPSGHVIRSQYVPRFRIHTSDEGKLASLWAQHHATPNGEIALALTLDHDSQIALAERLGEIAGRLWREGKL